MNDPIMNTVIKTLAETIQRLQVDVDILKFENERLKKKNEDLMMAMGAPVEERRKDNA